MYFQFFHEILLTDFLRHAILDLLYDEILVLEMKTYRVNEIEYNRVLHGNRSIKMQGSVHCQEWVLFFCPDKPPIQARVSRIYVDGGVFKTYGVEGVAEFPFPMALQNC